MIATALFFVGNSCNTSPSAERATGAEVLEGDTPQQIELMSNNSKDDGESQFVIGFDPGRDKCGIARVKLSCRSSTPVVGKVLSSGIAIDQMRVVESASAIADVVAQCQKFPISTIVMGDGTSSKHWRTQLDQALPATVTLVTVNEYNSTQEARDRYWTLHPSRGLSRIIPAKLRSIPCPIDDIVAVILVERWLAKQSIQD